MLFERGILAHVRIWSGDSAILKNMEKGYKFFCSWLDGLLQEGMKCIAILVNHRYTRSVFFVHLYRVQPG